MLPPDRTIREAVFHYEFREDIKYWVKTDRKIALRALKIVEAIMKDPFLGIGKPERLKYLAPGAWSRRLTQEHRIVYLVRDDRVDFLQAQLVVIARSLSASSASSASGNSSPRMWKELPRLTMMV